MKTNSNLPTSDQPFSQFRELSTNRIEAPKLSYTLDERQKTVSFKGKECQNQVGNSVYQMEVPFDCSAGQLELALLNFVH